MPTLAEIEQVFWSQVWRCTHRQPCKKCCWPWYATDIRYGLSTWAQYATIVVAEKALPAYRAAFIFAHQTLILPRIAVRHLCHFKPCCNPAHLRLGSQSDNNRDNRGKKRSGEGWPAICLLRIDTPCHEDLSS